MHNGLPYPRLARATALAAAVLGLLASFAALAVHPSGAGDLTAAPASRSAAIERPAGPVAPARPESPRSNRNHRAPLAQPVRRSPAPRAATARQSGLPIGKGMWIWVPEKVERGSIAKLIARAQRVGLTHVYVRTGSSRMGFYAQDYLDRLLPAAHAAGIKVYGWDFPYFQNVRADVRRSVEAIRHRTPSGHRIDGFVPDIETIHEGTRISGAKAARFGRLLREAVGPGYPLLVAVPRPSATRIADFPYAKVIRHFDAVAPMVYWLNRQPDTDIVGTLRYLAQFGKPVVPIGQAYDGRFEGGRKGTPPRSEILRFMAAAEAYGATGVSFWSWQHADRKVWRAIRDAPQFTVPARVEHLRPPQIRALQVLLSSLGYPAPATGAWDGITAQALRTFQNDRGLVPTGSLDRQTRAALLQPGPVATGL